MMLAMTGCSKVPDHVIPEDDMARVMADIHMAETVIESNYASYPTDSAKMLLKQSVLARHGYDLQALDTSLVWYGAYLEVYRDVYDRTIKLLEKDLEDAGLTELERHRAENDGDSVDIWDGSRFLLIKKTTPSKFITYSYDANEDWTAGDMFTLRAKFTNANDNLTWTIMADYDDNSIELYNTRFSGDGWHETTFITDSLKNPKRIYGSMYMDVLHGAMLVDSIEFIRKPKVDRYYSQRYRQRAYSNVRRSEPKNPEPVDSIESSELPADSIAIQKQ